MASEPNTERRVRPEILISLDLQRIHLILSRISKDVTMLVPPDQVAESLSDFEVPILRAVSRLRKRLGIPYGERIDE